MNPFDLVLLTLSVFVLYRGWSRGLSVSLFSLIGLIIGAYIGRSLIVGVIPESVSQLPLRIGVFVFILMATVSVGSSFGAFVGRRIRSFFKSSSVKTIDHLGGLALSAITWSFLVWALSLSLSVTPFVSLTAQMSESRVLGKLDEVMPAIARDTFEQIRGYVSDAHLPESLVGVFTAPEVDSPNTNSTTSVEVIDALNSVVRVEGISTSCDARISGSGFIGAKNLIVTNAHVVAGVSSVVVRIKGKGRAYAGTVVYFDPARDVAIIRVKNISGTELPIVDQVNRGAETVVAGFPGGGKLTLVPARVRSIAPSRGTDIYSKKTVTRTIYAIRADIKQGDSGAPMLTTEGQVAGLVFASSATDKETGYVLAPSEFMGALAASSKRTNRVDTGECISDSD